MTCNCPKCDADISDSYQEDDPSVGIQGGYYCEACDLPVDDDYEPHEDDVPLTFAAAPEPRQIGTPLSELSGRPGHLGFDAFVRIAKSWGYD